MLSEKVSEPIHTCLECRWATEPIWNSKGTVRCFHPFVMQNQGSHLLALVEPLDYAVRATGGCKLYQEDEINLSDEWREPFAVSSEKAIRTEWRP